jgi:hypothetical protein
MTKTSIAILFGAAIAVALGGPIVVRGLVAGPQASSTAEAVTAGEAAAVDGELAPYLTCFKVEEIVKKLGEGKVEFKGIPAPRHVCYKGDATLKL